ncbi:DUF4249 domain-containing protein [uncultured Flavobacterium sp.]|uniref:DUF4249 domain-containing protein n=1 Tax=uncultured Flavobacterium sp. TaxID=165435 RepID=UPI0030EECC0A
MEKVIFLLTFIIVTSSCTEPYALQSNTFEDVIVIEATITNELKIQEIKISRTFQLEEKEPQVETNAIVYIIDDLENKFNFVESNGKYISQFEFQAMPERQYQLFINTSNGKQYTSTREKLTAVNNLNSIEATVKNKFGVNGVDITANSFDPIGTSKYYRYEYEETYRFIVPYWAPDSLKINYYVDPQLPIYFITSSRSGPSKTCYKTDKSTEIILENTTNYSEDRIENFSVRFISQTNFIIADRYSILVKQYIQNLAAFTFYKTLKDLSASGNVLTPNQPGFFSGNISSIVNKNEKVIGFFDVSTLSVKRLFFNYDDFFPGEEKPKYFIDCEVIEFDISLSCAEHWNALCGMLVRMEQKTIILYEDDDPLYNMVIPKCGDCRTVGSNIVPAFWQ